MHLGSNLWVIKLYSGTLPSTMEPYLMGPIIKIQTVNYVWNLQNGYEVKSQPLIPHMF